MNWEAVLWLTVIRLVQAVTFFVIVLLVRLAIRDRKRELAAHTPNDATATPAAPAPEEPQLVRSRTS